MAFMLEKSFYLRGNYQALKIDETLYLVISVSKIQEHVYTLISITTLLSRPNIRPFPRASFYW